MKIHLLPDILDLAAEGATDTEIGRALNITPRSLWNYMRKSLNGDEDMICEWAGVTAPYHEHRRAALKLNASLIEQKLRSIALNGTQTPLSYQGQPTYKEIEAVVGWTPDEREALGFARDGLERDASGARIPLTIYTPPPPALLIKVAESFYPKTYGKSVDHNLNVAGVLRLGMERANSEKPELVQIEQKQIEHRPMDEVAPVEVDEVENTAPPMLAIGPAAKDAAEFDQWKDEGAFEPQVVAFQRADGSRTEHIAGNPAVDHSPDNPIRQAMAAELEAHEARIAEQAKDSGPPAASPVVAVFKPEPSDPPEIVGARKSGPEAAPVTPISANHFEALIDHAIASVNAKVAANAPMSAVERQIKNAADRGSRQRIAELVAPRREVDQVGAGNVVGGGMRIVR